MHTLLAPLLLSLLVATLPPAQAQALAVERVHLPGEAGHQVYNYQEQGGWRVWARSAAGFKASQIWLQGRAADGRWGDAAPWPHSDPRYRDSDPFVDTSSRRLLFVSDRPLQPDGAPLTQLDLFESEWDGSRWSTPRRLPEALQSPQYELGPEQHGGSLWFGSYRKDGRPGTGRLAIYRTGPGGPLRVLPAPVNDEGANSDPTPSPDGRYLLWWSARSGNGDLFMAERLAGDRHGPALPLPAAINSDTGFEFTPWLSADGDWLYFASTRPSDDDAGLAKLYRVHWPTVLRTLGPATEAASQAELDRAVNAFWHTLSHAADAASDTATLGRLLHPQARIWGSGVAGRNRQLQVMGADEFLAAMGKPSPRPLQECELAREQRRYGAMAQVYSHVRSDREAGSSPYVGVNSQQWHWDAEQGWRLLSLHYALDMPGQKLPAQGVCMARPVPAMG